MAEIQLLIAEKSQQLVNHLDLIRVTHNQEQLDKFKSEIDKIDQVKKNVQFIITDPEAQDYKLDEIKYLFKNYFFADRIEHTLTVDKTEDPEQSKRCEEKYGFYLEKTGDRVDFWLRENYKRLNIGNFVLVSKSFNDGAHVHFPRHTSILNGNSGWQALFYCATNQTRILSEEVFFDRESIKGRITLYEQPDVLYFANAESTEQGDKCVIQ